MKALSGIVILDLGEEKASFCSKLLADLGAGVIKVEKPGGSNERSYGPFLEDGRHQRLSLSFLYHNSGKSFVTCNLENRAGRMVFRRLVRRADVVIEGFKPGYLNSLQLDYDRLRRINPGIIMASVTGFGQSGPKSSFEVCDLVAAAFGGQMAITGFPGEAPLRYYGNQSYYTASLAAAIGILLSLRQRRLCGHGDHIDISLQASVASTLERVMPAFFQEKMAAGRTGGGVQVNGFCIFPCRDGFVQISIQHQWPVLLEWIKRDGMADELDPDEWSDFDHRRRHFDVLSPVIRGWTRTYPVAELVETAQLMGLPWAPVVSPEAVLDSPQLRSREFFREMRLEGKSLRLPGLPFPSADGNNTAPEAFPEIGKDNDRIWIEELGFSRSDLGRLRDLGAI